MSVPGKRASSALASPGPATAKRQRGDVQQRGGSAKSEHEDTRPPEKAASNENESPDALGRIFVAVRIRPLNKREREAGGGGTGNTVIPMFHAVGGTKVVETQLHENGNGASPAWEADAVFDYNDDNAEVYSRTAAPVVAAVLSGINGTVMAYGQTSSGKTHTMSGTETDPGVMTRAVEDIFAAVDAQRETRRFAITASYLEIYNEEIRDLLAESSSLEEGKGTGISMSSSMMGAPSNGGSANGHGHIKLVNDAKGLTQVIGLTERVVTSSAQISDLVTEGTAKRSTGRTAMNTSSSRSHAVLRLTVCSIPNAGHALSGPAVSSTLYVVDLAGSERADPNATKTARHTQLKKEGSNINQSLLTLRLCVQRLATASANGVDSKHVPYRDSKLTRILQPALAGPGRTAIVAAVTPSAKHVNETYSTLNFVGVAKSVLISAKTNVVKGGLGANAAYDSEITIELRSQIATDNIAKKHMQEEMERALAELSEAGARIAAAEARADAAAAAAEFAERAAVVSKAQVTAAELRASDAERERDVTARHAATAATVFMDAKTGNKADTEKLVETLREVEDVKRANLELSNQHRLEIKSLGEQHTAAQEQIVVFQNEAISAKEAEDAALSTAAIELEAADVSIKKLTSEVDTEKQRCAAMKASLERARLRVVEAEKVSKLAKEEIDLVREELRLVKQEVTQSANTTGAEKKTLAAEVEKRVSLELALDERERRNVTLAAELTVTRATLERVERDALCETTALEQERCAAKELDEAATMALGEVERLSGEVERLSQELLVAKQTSEQNAAELIEARVDLELAKEELDEVRNCADLNSPTVPGWSHHRTEPPSSPFSPGTTVRASTAMKVVFELTETTAISTFQIVDACEAGVAGVACFETGEADTGTAVVRSSQEVTAVEATAPIKRARGRPKKVRTETEQKFHDLKLNGKKATALRRAAAGGKVDKENPDGSEGAGAGSFPGRPGVVVDFSLKNMISAVGVKKKPLEEAGDGNDGDDKKTPAKKKVRRLANVGSLRDVIGSPLENGRFMSVSGNQTSLTSSAFTQQLVRSKHRVTKSHNARGRLDVMSHTPGEDELETRGDGSSLREDARGGTKETKPREDISLLGKSNETRGVDRDDLEDETSQLSNSTRHAEEPEDLTCPITKMMYRDPVFVAGSGNTYERGAISTFWEGRVVKRDPLTNSVVKNNTLFTNWTKRREVDAWLTRHPGQCPEGWGGERKVPPPLEASQDGNAKGNSTQAGNGNRFVNKLLPLCASLVATVAVITSVFLASTTPAPPPGFPQFPPGVVASTLRGSGVTGMPAPPAWFVAMRAVKPPAGSRITARRGTRGALEIVIPPAATGDSNTWSGSDVLPEIGFAATWTAFTGMWTYGAFRGPTPAVALFSVPFWGVSAHLGKTALSVAVETTRVVFFPPSDSEVAASSGDVAVATQSHADGTFQISWEAFGRAVGTKKGSLHAVDGVEIVTRAFVNGVAQTNVELRLGVSGFAVGKSLHHAEQKFIAELMTEALAEARVARGEAKQRFESEGSLEVSRDGTWEDANGEPETGKDVAHETISGDTQKIPPQARL